MDNYLNVRVNRDKPRSKFSHMMRVASFCLCVVLAPILLIVRPFDEALNALAMDSTFASPVLAVCIFAANAVDVAAILVAALQLPVFCCRKFTIYMFLSAIIIMILIVAGNIGKYFLGAVPVFIAYCFLFAYSVYKNIRTPN
jgi:hypothetical protein